MSARHPTHDGNQEAFARRVDEELCGKLSAKYARRAAPDERANVRLRLEKIVEELRCLPPAEFPPEIPKKEKEALFARIRSTNAAGKNEAEMDALAELLTRSEPRYHSQPASQLLARRMRSSSARKRALDCMERVIRRYLLAQNTGQVFAPQVKGPTGRLKRRVFSSAILEPLALEWLREPSELRSFLADVFAHWNTLDEPTSTWRRSLVVHQIAAQFQRDSVRILTHLQKIGAVPPALTVAQQEAQLATIRQMLSRETRRALGASREL